MAYDEALADRIRFALAPRRDVEEKKMFGGVAFMVRGHMALGVSKDRLMARVEPDQAKRWLDEPHVTPMDFTGRPMRGFLFVGAPAVSRLPAVRKWVRRCLEFNAAQPAKSAASGRKRARG